MTNREAIRLERASSEMRDVLANLLELYSHDLSDAFAIDVGADGRFGYPKLDLYWSSPDSHYAFVFRCGGHIAGFALVTRGSPLTEDPSDLDVAEFFVLRRYRRIGVGRQAACALWDTLTGRWVVRVSETNRAALTFWIDVVRRYTGGKYTEASRDSAGHRWRVFSFDTPSTGHSAL
jgi:predicted acetyltransferase